VEAARNESKDIPGFTAHNILLDDGTQTLPSQGRLLAEEGWCQSATKTLKAVFPGGLQGKRIVDLACLEGGYAVEFARLGMNSLGIEIRPSNFTNCMLVKNRLSLPNLNFVQDDVWNLEKYGTFDAIYCCGILYHLDRPREFINILSRQCVKLLIINTHFAPEKIGTLHKLSEITHNENLRGRWLVEFEEKFDGDRDSVKWASWDNNQSFWPDRGSLLAAIYAAGFPIVMEQYDWMENWWRSRLSSAFFNGVYENVARGIFVGIKP
jgi:SAM-dependent methyltransferase